MTKICKQFKIFYTVFQATKILFDELNIERDFDNKYKFI